MEDQLNQLVTYRNYAAYAAIIGSILALGGGWIWKDYSTQISKIRHDDVKIGQSDISNEIGNLVALLGVEDNLSDGTYRFTFKNKEGKIVSEDKSLNDFLKPYLNPLESQIRYLQENLAAKSADSKTKIVEIQSLKDELSSLQSDKEKLELNLKSFLNFITKVQIENTAKIFKEAISLVVNGRINEAIEILSEEKLTKDESAILNAVQSHSDLRLLKANLMAIANKISEANTNFEKSIELNQNLYNTFQYADYLQFQRDFEKAIQYYNVALTITKDEIELGNMHNNLANTFNQNGDYYNAEKHYKKAIEYRKNFAKNKSNQYKGPVAKSLSNYGAFLFKQGRQNESKSILEEAKSIHQELLAEGIEDHLYSYSLLLMNIGIQYSEEKKYNKSIPLLEQALKLKRKILNGNQSMLPFSELPIVMMNLAVTYSYAGKLDLAKPMIDEARLNLQKAVTKMPSVYLEPYSSALITSAGIYKKLNLIDDTNNFYKEGLELCRDLFEQNSEANFRGYSRALNNYGAFLNENGKHSEALKVFNELERILDNYNGIDTNSMKARKGILYLNYGIVYSKMNDSENSILNLNKVITTLKPLLSTGNTEIQGTFNQATQLLKE